MIAQADEYKISLTEEEQAQAEQEAGDFYNSLTDEQLKETGMEADTPSRVLQENALAKKIYDHVMSDSSAEVSDEQARMTTFYDMFFECYYEDDFGNIVVYSKDKIAEQKQKADEAYTSIKQQLSDNPNLNITFLGHTNNLRYAGRIRFWKAMDKRCWILYIICRMEISPRLSRLRMAIISFR